MTETKTFKCPSCGAPLAYDGADAKLTCAHCGAEIEPDAFLDDEDFDFDDADECISDTAADIADVNKQNDELIEEAAAPEESEGQL